MPGTQEHPNRFLQVLFALLAVAAFVWFMQIGRVPMQVIQRRDCENQYRLAHTAADTEAVDERQPLVQSSTVRIDAPTCGTLRKSGKLQ